MSRRYLIAATRGIVMLGLLALTFTGEVGQGYIAAGWIALVLGFFLDRRPELQTPLRHAETMAVVVLIAVIGLDFFIQHLTVFLTITHFLMLFQMFKCLGLKERKDCLQMLLFGFFQILAACTLSIELSEGLTLLCFVPLASIGFFWHQVEWERERSGVSLDDSARQPYRWATVFLGLGALPVNLLLTLSVFLFFPRLTFNMTIPGLTNHELSYGRQIDLGVTGSLQQSKTPVLWLQFASEDQRVSWNGYLRGDTLENFDGRQWLPSNAMRPQAIFPDLNHIFHAHPRHDGAPTLHADILMVTPTGSSIFTTGQAVEIAAPINSLLMNSDGSIHAPNPFQKPLRYSVVSEMESSVTPTAVENAGSEDDLDLPPLFFARTQALTQQIAGSGTALDQARKIEVYLRTHYKYSLQLADPKTGAAANPVEDFLFNRKQGPCSYFASAMAVMLRLQGIPSRIVAGYLQGEWNKPAGQYLIRDSDSHAWVEAYLPGLGWRTFDPSPRDPTPLTTRHFSPMHDLMQYWDYSQLQWNHLVIDYDLYTQVRALQKLQDVGEPLVERLTRWRDRRLLGRLGQGRSSSTTMPLGTQRLVLWSGITAVIGFLGVGLWRRKRMLLHDDQEVRSYQQFLNRMARAGVPKRAAETGWEYAERLNRAQPAVRETATAVTAQYYVARFSKRMTILLAALWLGGFSAHRAFADADTTNIKTLISDLKSGDDDRREHAAEALKNMGPAAAPAIPALRKALSDDLPYVRNRSAAALASIGAPAVPAFIEALSNDSSDVRAISATALAHLGDAAVPAIPALVNTLKDSDPTVRSNAATALMNLGQKSVGPITELFKDDNAGNRLIAVRTIGGIDATTPGITTALMSRFSDDNPQVRLAAVKALSRRGAPVVSAMIEGLQSGDSAVREQSCTVLADVGHASKEAVSPLTSLLKDSDAGVRGAAAVALGKIGSAAQPAVPELQNLMKDSDPSVASKAQEAVTNISALFGQKNTEMPPSTEITTVPLPPVKRLSAAELKRRAASRKANALAVARMAASKKQSAAVSAQIKKLGDDDDVVRLEASQRLVEMGPKAVDGLINAVTHSTITVRVYATSILGQIGAPATTASPLLTENLRAPEVALRQPSAISLLQIDSMTAFATLTDIAKQDPDSAVRLNAIQVLGQMGAASAPAVPGLIEVLKDSDTAISSKASLALTQIGTPDASTAVKMYDRQQTNKKIQEYLKTLRANGPAIDAKAVEGLASIGSPAVASLAAALKDSNVAARGGAASALNRLGKDAAPATQPLIDALDDSDITVRKQAAASLGKIDSTQSESALRFFSEKEWMRETLGRFKK